MNRHADGEPVLGAIPSADLSIALAILAALRARDRDGPTISSTSPCLTARSAGPRGRFETADGFLVVTVGGDRMVRVFCTDVAARPDWLEDSRLAAAERMRHGAAFLAEVEPIFRGRPGAHGAQIAALAAEGAIGLGTR